MVETKHTPGEWHIRTNDPQIFINSSGDVPLAEIAGASVRDIKACRDNAFANARLIAAAPDLLEALKAILSKEYMMHSSERIRAEAAIRKAELGGNQNGG